VLKTLLAAIAVAAVLAAGPAGAAKFYLVDSMASEATHHPVRAQARELVAIFDDLRRVSGVDATLVYSTDRSINAFATEVKGERIVLVQAGLLADFDHDRDAVAAVLGHELAHHKGDHIRAGHRKQQNMRVFGAVLGAVVGAKVGDRSGDLAGAASGAAVGLGAHMVALKFSRSQELEADRLAVGWMVAAGYNPQGMLRLQERFGALDGKQRSAILRTHPASRKRYQAAEREIAKLAPPAELLAREPAPMVGEAALAAAIAEIEPPPRATVALRDEAIEVPETAPQKALEASSNTAGSGVHFSGNVQIRGNVRVNGQLVGEDAVADED
jgi:Zn-dependent protease with chaperone function